MSFSLRLTVCGGHQGGRWTHLHSVELQNIVYTNKDFNIKKMVVFDWIHRLGPLSFPFPSVNKAFKVWLTAEKLFTSFRGIARTGGTVDLTFL